MKKRFNIRQHTLIFSKWSRKKFAIFCSLHKVVNIAHLAVDICLASMRKNLAIITETVSQNINLIIHSEPDVPDDLLLNLVCLPILVAPCKRGAQAHLSFRIFTRKFMFGKKPGMNFFILKEIGTRERRIFKTRIDFDKLIEFRTLYNSHSA